MKGQAESWRFWKLGLEDRQKQAEIAETRMKRQTKRGMFALQRPL
jgi:hypothetical protein